MAIFIQSYESILTKNVLGYILGDFFTNSESGHPDANLHDNLSDIETGGL
jgi:hypothetical protein